MYPVAPVSTTRSRLGGGLGSRDEMGNSEVMGAPILSWDERLKRLRARADGLSAAGAKPALLPLDAAERGFARLRSEVRPLLDATAGAYAELCPPGYPKLQDNGIP